MPEKAVTIITTGGTIAMSVDPETGGAIPLLSGEDLIKSMPALGGVAHVEIDNYLNKPGAHLSLDEVFELGGRIRSLFDQGKASGVVVTHGTDTLEETAYMLDLLVPHQEPVVVTGAMRNASMPSADGAANIYNSILTAASADARGRGTLVVFNNEIHPARDVTKTSATQLNTFRSPLFGPLGAIYGSRVQFMRSSLPRQHIAAPAISARVELIKFTLGMSPLLLEAVREASVDGVVVEGAGVGHVSIPIMEAMKNLLGDGRPVVLTSRCYESLVLEDSYAFPGSEKTLREIGVIMAPGLSGPKARLKLVLALSLTRDITQIREIFSQPIAYGP